MLIFYTTKCKEKFNGTEYLKVNPCCLRYSLVDNLSYLFSSKWYIFTK